MNSKEQLIEEFYAAFAEQNVKTMVSCYHLEIEFQDPVFGVLKGNDVADMWKMLIERSKGNIQIVFSEIKSQNNTGSAKWVATYFFSKTNRKVVNTIRAQFEFKDGLIIRHKDVFNLWDWSKQALGWKGLLLGWTKFMHQKIQQQAIESLRKYQNSNNIN